MTRGPLALAALASAAVPGLDAASVEGVVTGAGHPFDVAFVQDTDHRRWVVRAPRHPAASAQLEQSAALLAVLARRLTMPVPSVKGWAPLPEGGRAAVHSYLTGQVVDLAALAPGTRLAAGIGRAVAQVHNLDVAVYEEAGVPSYDAEAYRTRRLAELDRAAATGRVPTGLLSRWETTLEDVGRWRYQPVPTHGAISGETLLATPTDDESDAELKALIGWESAQVADPADDLATIVGAVDEETLDTVLEAYAHTRVHRPDPHLLERARLVDEMRLVRTMTAAVAAGDDEAAEEHAARLRRLDESVAASEPTGPIRLAPVVALEDDSGEGRERPEDEPAEAVEPVEPVEPAEPAEPVERWPGEEDDDASPDETATPDETDGLAAADDVAAADASGDDATAVPDTPEAVDDPEATDVPADTTPEDQVTAPIPVRGEEPPRSGSSALG